MRDFVAHVRRHLSRRDVAGGPLRRGRRRARLRARGAIHGARRARRERRGRLERGRSPRFRRGRHSLTIWRRDRRRAPPRATRPSRLRAVLSASSAGCDDLKLGLRVLRKDRGFTVTAIVTLAICLGGHAAIVAGVNAVLFHPLRTPEPDRVLLMANQYPRVEARRGTPARTPDYDDRLRHVTAFEEQALYNFSGATIEIGGVADARARHGGHAIALPSACASRPAHGPLFTEDEGTPGQRDAIILTDGLWRELFNARSRWRSGARCGSPDASSRSSACFLATSRSATPTRASGFRWR